MMVYNEKCVFYAQKRSSRDETKIPYFGDQKYEVWNFQNRYRIQKNKKLKNWDFQKNPYNLIKSSDIFILSSIYEGLPNVLLESQVLKKFIISSDCPTGPREILLNGNAGLLFKVGDYIKLSNLILHYSKNKKNLSKKILIGYKNLNRFDYNQNLKKYFKTINSLI